MITNIEKKNKYAHFMIFLTILLGSNTLISTTIIGGYKSIGLMLFMVICIFSKKYILGKEQLAISKQYLSIISILLICIGISMFLNFDMVNGNFLTVLKIIQGVLLVLCIQKDDFKYIYSKIMAFLGLYSLIVSYILINTSVKNIVPVCYNSTGLKFFNFGLSFVLDASGSFGMRNYGIFTEPAMYTCFLIPALIFEVSNREKARMWVIISLSVTALSTFSPVALICTSILLGVFFLYKNSIKIQKKIFLGLCLFLLITIFYTSGEYDVIIKNIAEKFNQIKNFDNSRFDSILINLELWLNRPLFGNGITGVTITTDILGSNTSTTTAFLAAYGIIFSLVMNLGLYSLFYNRNKKIQSFIIFIVYLIVINGQALLHTDYYWIFVMGGLLWCENKFSIKGREIEKWT